MTEWIKTPQFDKAAESDAKRLLRSVASEQLRLDVGTEVQASYKGSTVHLRIEGVLSEDTFMGRVLGFQPETRSLKGLSVGDRVRLRKAHIRSVKYQPG